MLTDVIKTLGKNKIQIKNNINNAHLEQNTYGTCPKCGKNLILIISRNKKRFIGCTGYPDCKNTYPLPQKGGIYKTDKICDKCKTSIISVKTKGKKSWKMCLDIKCKAQN